MTVCIAMAVSSVDIPGGEMRYPSCVFNKMESAGPPSIFPSITILKNTSQASSIDISPGVEKSLSAKSTCLGITKLLHV